MSKLPVKLAPANPARCRAGSLQLIRGPCAGNHMSEIRNATPHDDFFKLIMDVKENVAEFIRSSLPEYLVSNLDLSTLQNRNTSYTDGKVGNYRADVVYTCQFDDEEKVTITFLFEHKSYKPKFAHFQLLNYLAAIYWDQIRNGEEPGPVVPVVFYHGQQKWEYKGIFDHFKGGKVHPALQQFVPKFDFYFANLQEQGDEWIEEHITIPELRMSLLLMRNIRSDELLDKLKFIFGGVQEMLKSEEGREKFDQIYLYLKYGSKESEEKIIQVMDHATYMSRPIPVGSTAWQILQKAKVDSRKEGIAEGKAEGISQGISQGIAKGKAEGIAEGKAEGISQGIAKGKAEGIAEGKKQTAINLLREGLDAEMIARVTNLKLAIIEDLRREHL